jgi:molybdopterin converting factor small subunit
VSCRIKIEVRLFATLTAYLPGREGNAANMELPDGATVGDLVQMLAIPDDLPRVTLVNGRNAELDQRLLSGDVVTLFPPLAGGSAPFSA